MSKFYPTQPVRCVHNCGSSECLLSTYYGSEGIVVERVDPDKLSPKQNVELFLMGDPELYVVSVNGSIVRDNDYILAFAEDDLEPIQFDADDDEVEESKDLGEPVLAEV